VVRVERAAMHRYALMIAACLILVGAVDVLVGGAGLYPDPAPLELDEGARPAGDGDDD